MAQSPKPPAAVSCPVSGTPGSSVARASHQAMFGHAPPSHSGYGGPQKRASAPTSVDPTSAEPTSAAASDSPIAPPASSGPASRAVIRPLLQETEAISAAAPAMRRAVAKWIRAVMSGRSQHELCPVLAARRLLTRSGLEVQEKVRRRRRVGAGEQAGPEVHGAEKLASHPHTAV